MSRKQVTHPLTGQVYRLTEDGLVEVTDPRTGASGIFDFQARWQSGELRHADLQMAGWVGRLAQRRGATPPEA
ncbi:transposase [Streptomyces sp. NPDC086033]|uniref:transposase n=1 Tax=unclassified Streptomyces TaxID=2593676 RepID=UPI0008519732|nr:transposase [Streptomyces sp. LUP47B]